MDLVHAVCTCGIPSLSILEFIIQNTYSCRNTTVASAVPWKLFRQVISEIGLSPDASSVDLSMVSLGWSKHTNAYQSAPPPRLLSHFLFLSHGRAFTSQNTALQHAYARACVELQQCDSLQAYDSSGCRHDDCWNLGVYDYQFGKRAYNHILASAGLQNNPLLSSNLGVVASKVWTRACVDYDDMMCSICTDKMIHGYWE